ncbi:hypothetical protein C4D60_Mb05t05150 [Musa balbisiana]|uniref:Uncharacterized protein n=1 Tax=Musa balbisiana TaxID=52838 RepID=A0A4S8JTU9_MUSBA|nr:hypothetical protein C4D60_Mb05t05150 [Musa balbisiana]
MGEKDGFRKVQGVVKLVHFHLKRSQICHVDGLDAEFSAYSPPQHSSSLIWNSTTFLCSWGTLPFELFLLVTAAASTGHLPM